MRGRDASSERTRTRAYTQRSVLTSSSRARQSASERARDWQLHFEEFSGLTRPSLRRRPSSPSVPPPATAPFQSSFFLLSLSASLPLFLPLSPTTLFWAYGLQLRAGRLGTPFCFIVRSSVRFCAHLPHSLSPPSQAILQPPSYPYIAGPPPPPTSGPPSHGPPYARALAFSYFLTFSFLQCLKMQK